MNRRTVVTGAAAFAASAVVPAGIASTMHRDLPSAEAAEFAAIVMSMPAEKQALFAAMLRKTPGPLSDELADAVEQLAVQGGWVRGEQHNALLRAVSL